METDPLGPSTGGDLEVKRSNNKSNLQEEGQLSPDPLDFICFVCNNEFDNMAKLHVHMSMKHKGVKVYV